MIKPPAGRPVDLVNEGLIAGQKIAKISVLTLVSIGIAEIIMGQISGSVVATADVIDSLSDPSPRPPKGLEYLATEKACPGQPDSR